MQNIPDPSTTFLSPHTYTPLSSIILSIIFPTINSILSNPQISIHLLLIFSLMASESQTNTASQTTQSIFERLINSRNRDLSVFIPFVLGFTTSRVESPESESDPDDDSGNRSSPGESTRQERIILINPVTQTMVVIDGTGFDSLLRGAEGKGGQPPASKSAVEAMPRVEIREGEERGECMICLEEFSVGSIVKKMPCKHGFHEGCIEKWLGIHGSCPVCRYKMPVDEEESKKSEERENGGDDGGRLNQEFWVSLSFGGRMRRGGDDQSESGNQMMENDSDQMENGGIERGRHT